MGIRSSIFHAVVAVWFLSMLLLTPVFMMVPRAILIWGFHKTIRGYLWLLRFVCGLRYELRGANNIPYRPVLFASKHLSKWDSAVLPVLLGEPAVVLRREMLYWPLAGIIVRRLEHLLIPRQRDVAAAAQLIQEAKIRSAEGRSILIFPEGTRTPINPFPAPNYKRGVLALYKALGAPCVPIAINSGLFWPPHSLRRYPGTVIVEILPPIPPELPADQFLERLTGQLETNSKRLVAEAIATMGPHQTASAPSETEQLESA